MTDYQLYLAAFSCASTGAIASADFSKMDPKIQERQEAAQALGTADGLTHKCGREENLPRSKRVVTRNLDSLLADPASEGMVGQRCVYPRCDNPQILGEDHGCCAVHRP